IGAEWQANQAAADLRVAQAQAEVRRAAAVAREQEMKALVEENRAKVVLAEAEVPLALAHAFREGHMGVMDYYNLRNVQSDTEMRNAIAAAGALRNERPGQPPGTESMLSGFAVGILNFSAVLGYAMDWAQWIIPLIVIAGWILKQLANNKVDAQRRPERAPAPQPANPENPRERPMASGRPPEEIRKFLEELRRKRPAPEDKPAEREEEFTAQVVNPKRPSKPPPVPPPLPQPRRPVGRPSRPVIAELTPATAPKLSAPPPPPLTTLQVPVPAPTV